MNYKNINDYELVYQIRESDEEAYNTLFDKYSFLVKRLAYEYYYKNENIGIEIEDLCQEGYFAISVALKDYDQDNSLFYTYVLLCIRREMERYIKYCKRNKQMILNNAVSLSVSVDDSNELFLEDLISSGESLEDTVIGDEIYKSLFLYKHNLSFEESLIYELKINKFNNKEIATLLDLSYKRVDNSLRKIRTAISNYNLTL